MVYSQGASPYSPWPGKGTLVLPVRMGRRPLRIAERVGVHWTSMLWFLKRTPSAASASRRGVGTRPP